VQTVCNGLSAADIESLITVPIEQALNGLAGLDVMRSRSVPQESTVLMIFKPGTDLMAARLQVQERINVGTASLPSAAAPPFMVQPKSSMSRVMKIGISSPDKSEKALINASLASVFTIRPRLMRVPGVANVAIWGTRPSALQVQADPQRLQDHNVSLSQVFQATADGIDVGVLKFSNGHEIGTGGFLDTPNQRLGIKHVMPLPTPE
jgi:multidrug efflux pump subunit AcrB